jgi:thiol-disulfide isomerase/thioredoxin
MRKFFTACFAVIFSVGVSAQQFQLSGSIAGLADENLSVVYPKERFGYEWAGEIPVTNGQFNKTFDLPASGWIKLRYKDKDRQFFLWRGAKNLTIKFDADFLDGDVELEGDAAVIHRFAVEVKEKFGSKLTAIWLTEQATDATNVDAMEMETFALRNDVIHALESSESAFPDDFKKEFKNHLGYYYYLSLFKYSEAKSKRSSIPKATEIPKVLIEGLNWERMNRATELDSEFFRELLLSFVDYKALEGYDFMKFADRSSAVQEGFNLARENLKDETLQFFLIKTMLGDAQTVQPSLLRQMRESLRSTPNSEVFVKMVEDSLKERLEGKDTEVVTALKHQVDHDQVDIEVVGLNGKTFKLSDLKGKVVYLDIWASWCGPCRKQFPAAKELKTKLSKKELKNIEFLYISIDNTETVWKLAIEELGIEGTHGLSQGGWGSEVTAKFGVNSIPRYVIIDKQGKVFDGNAPRPSDERLLEILRKLAAN